MSSIANTPSPPYYAVIFTSERTEGDRGYKEMSERMLQLVQGQPGFLGSESARDANGIGITVSYWQSLEDVRNWKLHAEHQIAQQKGKSDWYARYSVRICQVQREYVLE